MPTANRGRFVVVLALSATANAELDLVADLGAAVWRAHHDGPAHCVRLRGLYVRATAD
jgi:hypothetical protein